LSSPLFVKQSLPEALLAMAMSSQLIHTTKVKIAETDRKKAPKTTVVWSRLGTCMVGTS